MMLRTISLPSAELDVMRTRPESDHHHGPWWPFHEHGLPGTDCILHEQELPKALKNALVNWTRSGAGKFRNMKDQLVDAVVGSASRSGLTQAWATS